MEIAGGSLLCHGICGSFLKAARPGCGSSAMVPAGLGCNRGDVAWIASRDSQRSLRLQQQAQSEITQANQPISLESSENRGFAPPAVPEKSQVCVALLVLAPAKVKSSPSWLMCWIGVKHRDLGAEPPPICSLEHGRLDSPSQRMQIGISVEVEGGELVEQGCGCHSDVPMC